MSQQSRLVLGGTAGNEPLITRRALRQRRAGVVRGAAAPRLPVVIRASRTRALLVLLLAVVQPGRRGSLLVAGLAEGPTSRLAVFSYAFAAVGVLFAVSFARTSMMLSLDDEGRMVLVHQGFLRRRVILVRAVHAVRLVSGPAHRAILLDADGGVVATLSAFPEIWRRDDVLALLEGAGVAVGHEHRLNRASEIEAVYPGSTAWIERSPARLYGVLTPAVIGAVFLLAWFLQF